MRAVWPVRSVGAWLGATPIPWCVKECGGGGRVKVRRLPPKSGQRATTVLASQPAFISAHTSHHSQVKCTPYLSKNGTTVHHGQEVEVCLQEVGAAGS